MSFVFENEITWAADDRKQPDLKDMDPLQAHSI